MPESLARVIAFILLVVHAGLGAWALVGFIELTGVDVPWKRVSNPLFSPGMLMLQWSLIAMAAAVFIIGFSMRWRATPFAMLFIYSAMALVCAYQTFNILTHPTRFRDMAIEYLEYAVILAYLFFSEPMRRRFA